MLYCGLMKVEKLKKCNVSNAGIALRLNTATTNCIPHTSFIRELSSRLTKVTSAKAKQLWDTWNTIGFTNDDRRNRMGTVEDHVDNLLTRMVEEEVVLKDKLESDVSVFKSEIVSLCIDLHLSAYTVSQG